MIKHYFIETTGYYIITFCVAIISPVEYFRDNTSYMNSLPWVVLAALVGLLLLAVAKNGRQGVDGSVDSYVDGSVDSSVDRQ